MSDRAITDSATIDTWSPTRQRTTSLVAVGFFVTATVLGLLSIVASSRPDGLERVAIDNSISIGQAPAVHSARLADYAVPWWSGAASAATAAVVGIALCAAIAWAVSRLVLGRSATPQ